MKQVSNLPITEFIDKRNSYFSIPEFQRPYAWNLEQINQFIEDIENVKQGTKKHYFGTIVFQPDNDRFEIIDGQQRLTTVLLMLTAIYRILLEKPDSSTLPAEVIKPYLYNEYCPAEENRIKLRTVTTDNDIFERIFQDPSKLSEDEKRSRLYRAYNRFYEYLSERGEINQYYEALKSFEVVTIPLDSTDDNPQKIFENINSTGQPLSEGDKIRNYALMLDTSAIREHVYENYWKGLERSLTTVTEDHIAEFFYAYLQAKLQVKMAMPDTYRRFKEYFNRMISDQTDLLQIDNFYGDIVKNSNYYRFLRFGQNPSHAFDRIVNAAFRIRSTGNNTVFPYLMCVIDYVQDNKISWDDVNFIFKTIENYLVRRHICHIGTSQYSTLFATLHQAILQLQQPEESYRDAFINCLASLSNNIRFPSDYEISNAILNVPIYGSTSRILKLILSSVDDENKESRLLERLFDTKTAMAEKLTIEHIMPQTLSEEWVGELGINAESIHEQYRDALANLTLTAYNPRYSNKSFHFKKYDATDDDGNEVGFAYSPLLINKFIANFDSWGEEEIKARAAWWQEKISKLWPQIRSRNNVNYKNFALRQRVTTYDSAGWKSLDDGNSWTASKPASVKLFDQEYDVSSHQQVTRVILSELAKRYSSTFDDIAHSFPAYFSMDYRLKSDGGTLRTPKPIEHTDYYFEANMNANDLRSRILVPVIRALQLDPSDFRVYLTSNL